MQPVTASLRHCFQAPTAARGRTFQLSSKRANSSGGTGLLK
jgi:hypothetical protein